MKQREIRFRAWDGERMWPSNAMGVADGRCLVLDTGKSKDWPLMQFTGLKDKNGREIYEGDVVKWGHVDGGREYPVRIAEVRISAQTEFVSRQKEVVQCGKDEYRFGYGTFAYRETEKWLEVIGNIYENPELLKA